MVAPSQMQVQVAYKEGSFNVTYRYTRGGGPDARVWKPLSFSPLQSVINKWAITQDIAVLDKARPSFLFSEVPPAEEVIGKIRTAMLQVIKADGKSEGKKG